MQGNGNSYELAYTSIYNVHAYTLSTDFVVVCFIPVVIKVTISEHAVPAQR